MKLTSTSIVISAFVLLASCLGKSSKTTVTIPVSAPSAALTTVISATPEGEASSIATIRATAKPGDPITVSGRIMGREKPFVDGRAAFILGDPKVLTPCNEMPGDKCETPWDVCCETPEDKKRAIATIQVLGADGRVLKESIEGVAGLVNLASVTVTGTVAEGSSADALIINAKAIAAGK